MFGKLFHYSFDALLISILLASIHKSSGLTFNTNEFNSMDIRHLLNRYLALGEASYDYLVSSLRRSGYFTQRRIRNVDDLKDSVKKNVGDIVDSIGR
ncbi:hypothetical protein PACTADRAFT_74228 [Pachysolen tannophilus NRRL Y-2460]|uniref:DUF1748-domain-containing protein n=1 Tax=Pachysolen tannophilus NRRL Y-2460 TaxID=669874 RepID=A0A1E4TXZ1_PACTA|nr:hypothetical protein PACTADRAFT_74228 [Pachysolen tannophilus NRRL Y-2460]